MTATLEAPTTAPPRSMAQRMDALAKGNYHRTYRATLKRDVKAGRVSAFMLILNPPQEILTMKAWDLLMAIPKVGRTKLNRLFVTHHISPSKTIGGLSERQRGELVSVLRGGGR